MRKAPFVAGCGAICSAALTLAVPHAAPSTKFGKEKLFQFWFRRRYVVSIPAHQVAQEELSASQSEVRSGHGRPAWRRIWGRGGAALALLGECARAGRGRGATRGAGMVPLTQSPRAPSTP